MDYGKYSYNMAQDLTMQVRAIEAELVRIRARLKALEEAEN